MNQTFRILSLIEMCNPTWGEQKASVSRKNSFGLIILQYIAWALQIILFSFQLYHWYQNLIWHWCDTKTWYIWHWYEIKSIAVEAELVQSVAHFSAKAYNLQSSHPCTVVSSVPLLTSDWNVLSLCAVCYHYNPGLCARWYCKVQAPWKWIRKSCFQGFSKDRILQASSHTTSNHY